MINLNELAVDVEAEDQGKPFTLRSGMVVTLARTNNKAHKQKMAELLEPHAAKIRSRISLPPGVMEDISIKAFASQIIKGWSPIEYNGAPFPYSPENAEALLRDPGLHDFADEIGTIADSAESFRALPTPNQL